MKLLTIVTFLILLISSVSVLAEEVTFSREDRERLIRLEVLMHEFKDSVDKRFEIQRDDMNKRFEQVDKEHSRFFVTVCVIGAKQRCKGCGKPVPRWRGIKGVELSAERGKEGQVCFHNKGVVESMEKSSPSPAPPPAGDIV